MDYSERIKIPCSCEKTAQRLGEIFLEDAPYFIFGFIYCALILCCSYFGGTLLLSRLFQKDSTQPKEI